MSKKRFSLLIDDETSKQDASAKLPQKEKRFSLLIDDDNSRANLPSSQQEDRPHLSLFTPEEDKTPKKIPFSRKLTYWYIENKTVFLHRTYGIQINYNNQKTIQYLLEVKCHAYKKDLFYYTLHRKRFFKDGKQLDGFMQQLAEQSANCLYPLQVIVNKHGQITNVTNQEDIEKRWKVKQKELIKLYSGKPVIAYCKKISLAVSNPEAILKSLNNDVVYDILFSKLYINYSKQFTQPLEKQFKWFSGVQKIRFQGQQSVNSILKENGRMCINYKGVMKPSGGLTEGKTHIEYQLNAKDNTLLRADGIFNYSTSNQNKTIQFKAIWQQGIDKTETRKIDDKKRKGLYIPPGAKWWQIWKH